MESIIFGLLYMLLISVILYLYRRLKYIVKRFERLRSNVKAFTYDIKKSNFRMKTVFEDEFIKQKRFNKWIEEQVDQTNPLRVSSPTALIKSKA